MPKRKTISKKLRFEVFKRDSFKCRYCGRSPLDHPLTLQLDHVVPHSAGGGDDIVNLVTSCNDCNSGKSDRRLSDDALLKQTLAEMEALQERHNQIKQMVEWRKSLIDESASELNAARDLWNSLTPGWQITDVGLKKLKAVITRFGLSEVLSAMQICADKYLETGEDGKITKDSWETAFDYIGRVCFVSSDEQKNPGIQRLHYIKGILRNRFTLSNYRIVSLFEALKDAVAAGVPIEEIESKAKTARTIRAFEDFIFGND